MTLITVNIIPEVDIINLFDEEYTTPTQTFTLNGVVEVTTERPVHIRQVNLQFKGRVKSLVSFSDFIQESTQLNTNYEIPLKRWNTLEYDDTSVLQWVSRKALGYSHAYIDLIRQRETILDETVLLSTGKNVFPFSLEICNADRLPPSVILPQHKILYQLSAKIKLASFSEKFKVHYWSARSQRHTQELPPSPPLAPYEQDDFDPIDPSIMDSVELGDRDILLSQLSRSSKQENLGCSRLVQVCRHSYPSLLLLGSLHRVRYRGVRQRCLKYQVSMPRFACLQLPVFKFDCKFETLAHDANIKKVMYFIEQSEIYP
jgi:hypothetical protein